jgi:hypothetical protein
MVSVGPPTLSPIVSGYFDFALPGRLGSAMDAGNRPLPEALATRTRGLGKAFVGCRARVGVDLCSVFRNLR